VDLLGSDERGKTCSACGTEKPRSSFGKNKSRKDGMATLCLVCTRVRHNEWAKRAGRYTSDDRRAYLESRKSLLAERRNTDEWRAKRRAWTVKWRTNNPERLAFLQRRWTERDPGRFMRHYRAAVARDPARFMARQIYHRTGKVVARLGQETADWLRIIRKDPCSYCGSYENPQFDHVVPITAHGGLGWENLAAACKSCNSSKQARPLLLWLLTA
jgi:5-methylcytosine-specific restriction endonuclease McrA